MTINSYLQALDHQKDLLAQALISQGIDASENEKLNTLIPKVNQISNDSDEIKFILDEILNIKQQLESKADKEEIRVLTNSQIDSIFNW